VTITAETWTELRLEDIETLGPAFKKHMPEIDGTVPPYVVTWRDPYTRAYQAGIVRYAEMRKLAELLFPES